MFDSKFEISHIGLSKYKLSIGPLSAQKPGSWKRPILGCETTWPKQTLILLQITDGRGNRKSHTPWQLYLELSLGSYDRRNTAHLSTFHSKAFHFVNGFTSFKQILHSYTRLSAFQPRLSPLVNSDLEVEYVWCVTNATDGLLMKSAEDIYCTRAKCNVDNTCVAAMTGWILKVPYQRMRILFCSGYFATPLRIPHQCSVDYHT